MKYIAKYAPVAVDPKQAKEAHENEYYRKPHVAGSGQNLGFFLKTEEGIQRGDRYFGEGEAIKDKWFLQLGKDLVAHLGDRVETGPGYTVYLSGDGTRVLAESYVACSGNAVVIIHKEDESILYVNSRRHGIPYLAHQFMKFEPHEVVIYDSWRKDTKWHESGLEPPTEQEDFKEWEASNETPPQTESPLEGGWTMNDLVAKFA